MKLILAIVLCLLPSAVYALTQEELLAELDSAYVARTNPDPVDAFDLPAGRLEEFQVVVYSIDGTVWRPETIRYVTFGGQAYYLRSVPSKVRPPVDPLVAEVEQEIEDQKTAGNIKWGQVVDAKGDQALVDAVRTGKDAVGDPILESIRMLVTRTGPGTFTFERVQ